VVRGQGFWMAIELQMQRLSWREGYASEFLLLQLLVSWRQFLVVELFMTLFARLGAADAAGFEFFAVDGGGPAGVFDLGPGTAFASDASSSSRYRSP